MRGPESSMPDRHRFFEFFGELSAQSEDVAPRLVDDNQLLAAEDLRH